jgi:hypothetical protein
MCMIHASSCPTTEHTSLFPSSVQLMKLMQKKCNSIDPSTKSANARSCEMLSKSALFSGLVWMRSEAVRTNWPTVALKPERKALKGCNFVSNYSWCWLEALVTQLYLNMSGKKMPGCREYNGEGDEGIDTYKVSDYQAVQELQRAHHYQERHEGV